jgi:ATP-dependent Clp protease ATP-binding subunit ClpA
MFERFTPRARRAIVVAQDEAKALHHDLIRPEHLLLGLVQGEGIAAKALRQLGVNLDDVRAKVEGAIPRSDTDNLGSKVPFSPTAKKALELSLREALRLGHNYIGTEHIVLGVVQVLDDDDAVNELLGADANQVRAVVAASIPNGSASDLPKSPAADEATRLARSLAGSGPMTTGHLLLAMLTDPASQASRALGLSVDSIEPRLAAIPINETSDAPPRPQVVEIRLGEATTTIGDPELADALGQLSPEQLQAALRGVLAAIPQEPNPGPGKPKRAKPA